MLPNSLIYAFEPAEELMEQAIENVESVNNIKVIGSLEEVSTFHFDFIFCLEVFEHLPDKEFQKAFQNINRLSNDKTIIIIGVPVEIFLPALIKGIFRLTRRLGDVDARPVNILKSFAGVPPLNRPISSISNNIPYIIRHMGFDYRTFQKKLRDKFNIIKSYGSPISWFPNTLNFEVFYVCKKK